MSSYKNFCDSNEIKYFKNIYSFHAFKLSQLLGESFLDFGCGRFQFSTRMAINNPNLSVTVFDTNLDELKEGIKYTGFRWFQSYKDKIKPITVVSDFNKISNKVFDTIAMNFVLLASKTPVIPVLHDLVSPNGYVGILDYDFTNSSFDEFREVFTCDEERKAISRFNSVEETFQHYSSRGLVECKNEAEEVGFKTIYSSKFDKRYFFWIGQKL